MKFEYKIFVADYALTSAWRTGEERPKTGEIAEAA